MVIQIVTDTTAGLERGFVQQHGITVLPQMVIFGEQDYRDDSEMDTRLFLEMLKSTPELPKTAAPAPALYTPIYARFIEQGDTILVIAPTSEASGTMHSAESAAQEFPGAKIHVFDSRTIAGPMASMVMQAARWAAEGRSITEILTGLDEMKERQRAHFVVDTLAYLRRGGRIGGAQALIGGLLDVKPILTLRNGRVEPLETQRTHRKALHRLEEMVLNEYPRQQEGYLSIMHAAAEDEANALAADLAAKLGLAHVPVYLLPPAIIVHAGPGVIAAGYFVGEEQV